MALGNLAGNVGDEGCDPGMDAQESSHGKQTGGTATEFLGGFTLFALAFCCDIADVIVVCFLSEHLEYMVRVRITLFLELAEI